MATNLLRIKISVAWWLRYYIYGLLLMHWITGMGVNEQRVAYWLSKGMRTKVTRL